MGLARDSRTVELITTETSGPILSLKQREEPLSSAAEGGGTRR